MYFKFKDINVFAFSDTHGRHTGMQVPDVLKLSSCTFVK